MDETIKSALENWKSARALLSSSIQSYLDACTALRTACVSPLHQFPGSALIEDSLVAVESQLESLATDAKTLLNLQVSLKAMRKKLTTPARINTLPPEILADIFTRSGGYCAHIKNFSSRNLVSVCTYWRETALSVPELWAHIDIGPTMLYLNTDLLLERSKGSPIYVHLYEPEPPGDGPTPEYEVFKAMGVLTFHMHRVRALEMKSYSYSRSFMFAILNLWLTRGSEGTPTTLRVFRPNGDQVLGPDEVGRYGKLDSRSKHGKAILSSLRTLHLDGVQFTWDSGAYRGLVDLQLDLSKAGSIPISQSQFLSILSANPELSVLKMKHPEVASSGDQAQSTPVLLPNLQVLTILDPFDKNIEALLPLIALPYSSPDLNVSIECTLSARDHLQDLFVRSEIPTLVWDGNRNNFLLGRSPFRSIHSFQTLILHLWRIQDASQESGSDPGLPTSQSLPLSPLPSVVLVSCTISFDGLKALISGHHILNLRLDQCEVERSSEQSLEDMRDALLKLYPELNCSISNIDTTAELPCRVFFEYD
ncbi:hypothetical protein FRC09_005994 [Ceratobasidium sp. 395]|nr:hypothetical protein FRC09_005994 [Ceratobasidium sp. 395]